MEDRQYGCSIRHMAPLVALSVFGGGFQVKDIVDAAEFSPIAAYLQA